MKSHHADRMAALARDIASPKSVQLIDKTLEDMREEWLDLLGLRKIAARRHGVTTPPPSLPLDVASPEVVAPEVHRKNARRPPPSEPVKDLNLVAGSAADVAWKIIESRPMGITYAEMNEEYAKSPIGKNGKGRSNHYQSVQRLKDGGHVQVYKGRLWATHHLKKFQADVATGLKKDVEDQPKFTSRWPLAILSWLRSHNESVTTNQVFDHMKSLPEFSGCSIQQVCNVLNNLAHKHGAVQRKAALAKGSRRKTSHWKAIANYKAGENGIGNAEMERPTEDDLLSVGRVH
jgi:hypothetical protein